MFKVKFEPKEKGVILQTLGILEKEPYEIVLCHKNEDCENDKINIVFAFKDLDDVKAKIQFFAKTETMYLYGKTERGDVKVEINKVNYIEAFGNEVLAVVNKKQMDVPQKLYELEDSLKPFGFIRINKSQIVNVAKIMAVKTSFNGRLLLTLEDETVLDVNRSYRTSFKEYLKKR